MYSMPVLLQVEKLTPQPADLLNPQAIHIVQFCFFFSESEKHRAVKLQASCNNITNLVSFFFFSLFCFSFNRLLHGRRKKRVKLYVFKQCKQYCSELNYPERFHELEAILLYDKVCHLLFAWMPFF